MVAGSIEVVATGPEVLVSGKERELFVLRQSRCGVGPLHDPGAHVRHLTLKQSSPHMSGNNGSVTRTSCITPSRGRTWGVYLLRNSASTIPSTNPSPDSTRSGPNSFLYILRAPFPLQEGLLSAPHTNARPSTTCIPRYNNLVHGEIPTANPKKTCKRVKFGPKPKQLKRPLSFP